MLSKNEFRAKDIVVSIGIAEMLKRNGWKFGTIFKWCNVGNIRRGEVRKGELRLSTEPDSRLTFFAPTFNEVLYYLPKVIESEDYQYFLDITNNGCDWRVDYARGDYINGKHMFIGSINIDSIFLADAAARTLLWFKEKHKRDFVIGRDFVC